MDVYARRQRVWHSLIWSRLKHVHCVPKFYLLVCRRCFCKTFESKRGSGALARVTDSVCIRIIDVAK